VRSYATENSVQVQLLGHFGLRENPFGVTPDPRFLFLSQTHREALASLINGIDCDFGFQVLVAQPGMGKTTLLFNFLERFRITAYTVFLFQPQPNPCELVQSVLFELGINSEETSLRKLSEQLNQVLGRAAQERKRVIVVLDEAQNLEFAVLEGLRQLSNFETASTKLMQIVLAGQPQLAKRLALPEQEQLIQRISAIGRLSPLALNETQAYINHRLGAAGYKGVELFTQGAVRNVWNHSRGVPRNINTLCFNAMLLAFAEHSITIDERILEDASRDLDLTRVLTDLYQMESKADIRGMKRLNTDNAGSVVIKEPVANPRNISQEARATAVAAQSGDGNTSGTDENIPAAIVEALARISRALEEQKVLLAAKSVPLAEALPAAAPTLVAPAPVNQLDSTAATAIEAPTSSGKPPQPPPSMPVKGNVAVAIRRDSTANLGMEAARKVVEETVRTERKATLNIIPPRRNQSFLSEIPVCHSYQAVAKKHTNNGSIWAKALSLASIIGILAFVLIEKFPLWRSGQVEARETGRSPMVQTDSTAGYPASTELPASPIDSPNPPPKNMPTDSRGPRKADSNEFDEVIVRKFPTDSNVAAEYSGNTQELNTIFFDQDSALIGLRYRPLLRQIADALAENPEASAILEGYTDSSGPEVYNLDLSSRRAIAVRNALVNELHVSTTRLVALGAGSTAPIQPNSSAVGRAYNRRVDVRLVHLSEYF
jgi:type II secretory pathway predicted ATPase ExeA/outer membrane protein OmpA-like peptidoglycan-associated protein